SKQTCANGSSPEYPLSIFKYLILRANFLAINAGIKSNRMFCFSCNISLILMGSHVNSTFFIDSGKSLTGTFLHCQTSLNVVYLKFGYPFVHLIITIKYTDNGNVGRIHTLSIIIIMCSLIVI